MQSIMFLIRLDLPATCSNSDLECATNSFYGVLGCCDPNDFTSCTIPTTCIPSSFLSLCTDASCSENSFVTRCTNPATPFCFEFIYPFDSIGPTVTEWGCTTTDNLTATASRPLVNSTRTIYNPSSNATAGPTTNLGAGPTPTTEPQAQAFSTGRLAQTIGC